MRMLGPGPRAYIYIQYEMGEELGEGAFGKAIKAVRRRVRFRLPPRDTNRWAPVRAGLVLGGTVW